MNLAARYLDGRTSTAHPVVLELHDAMPLQFRFGEAEHHYTLTDLRISPRIGNTQRRIQLPDGGIVELDDNDALDRWLASQNAESSQHFVFRLERRWTLAIGSLVLVLLGTVAFIRYGVPAIATQVAYAIPTSVDERLGSDTLELMDAHLLSPSALPAERQSAIRHQFSGLVRGLPDTSRYRLEFRKGGSVGPNAFALPSGIIVITDELVTSSENDNEILAVLAHEVGHVVHRHSLRMLLQSSASAAVLFALLGDVASISSLAAGLPAMLTQARYSRDFETEADRYSTEWLRAHGIPTHYFRDILLRLERQQAPDRQTGITSYFSSHPDASERGRD